MSSDKVPLQDLEDAEDDAISLCDLPLHYNADELIDWEDSSMNDMLTSSEHEHFEFSSDPKMEICPSESIIFCGKLIPSKQPLSHYTHMHKSFGCHSHERAEPVNVNKLQSSSFCCDKFQIPSPSSYRPPAKPRWYMVMFGLTRMPREMELRDLRSRRDRLSQPALNGGETVSVRNGGRKGYWGLLRAFCRKGSPKAAVTSSIGCLPHVVKCGTLAARVINK